jgi:Htaa protein
VPGILLAAIQLAVSRNQWQQGAAATEVEEMTRETQPEDGAGTMLPAVAMVATLFALLAFAPFASAAPDPVSSGTTTLTLNKGFAKTLRKNGVKVLKVSPGTVKGSKVTLPVSGGTLDPTTGLGTVNQSGGIKFKAGKRNVALKSLVLDTTKKSLTGKVGSKSMKIASVVAFTATRDGFGVDIGIGKLKLTGKAAKELNKKLGFSSSGKKKQGKRASTSKAAPLPFKANQVLGGSTSSTQPTTVGVLAGGNATLKTDIKTVEKFQKVKVKFEPIAPATEQLLPLPPLFTFPIGSEGTIGPAATAGVLHTTGGVKLIQEEFEVKPGVKVQLSMTLNAIWIDLGTKQATVEVSINSSNPAVVPTPGAIGRTSIANIDLTGATVASDATTRMVSVSNATATLQAVTAETLNSVFAEPILKAGKVFVEGDPLGTFSFTAQTE